MKNLFKKIFNFGFKQKFEVPYDYKKIIFTYAVGGKDFEKTAFMLHNKMLQLNPKEYKKTLEYEFLNESMDVLSDYMKKASVKRQLLVKYQKEAQQIKERYKL